MRESRGSLGNERMRSAQIQVVTIAEEMGRTRTLGDCCSDTWNPGFSKTKVDITVPHLHSNSVLLGEHGWTEHVDNAPGNHDVTLCVYEFDYFRTQSRIPHYIVVMSPLASVDCGSFAEFLCFDDLDGIEEYRSGIFLM
ncbi:uncharacterized protein LOC113931550 isoform X4 [Zalophus californianus]|uniref:Uncharacterized protein LOC113931550 isoform X4 n=1 Tax=Zalophus californianus TaxID=9704 RepID=A0A6J2EIN4_ZALCA|nr:uncharacterized protein LOC113931550 isoform X4 [Zalophus californianus]